MFSKATEVEILQSKPLIQADSAGETDLRALSGMGLPLKISPKGP